MNSKVPGMRHIVRYTTAVLMMATLAACSTSRVDEVSVKWPPFKDGTLVMLPSDPAQCPDLAGTYRAQGERRAGDPEGVLLKDLHDFLAYSLDLPGMHDAPLPAWRSSPAATVSVVSVEDGWDVQAADGLGARAMGHLRLQESGARPAAADRADLRTRDFIQRNAGCTQGRLWISVRQDWRQHESMGVRRHVAVLRKQEGGLLVTVQRESDSIGMLLPWYTNHSDLFQYWFAPVAGRP